MRSAATAKTSSTTNHRAPDLGDIADLPRELVIGTSALGCESCGQQRLLPYSQPVGLAGQNANQCDEKTTEWLEYLRSP